MISIRIIRLNADRGMGRGLKMPDLCREDARHIPGTCRADAENIEKQVWKYRETIEEQVWIDREKCS